MTKRILFVTLFLMVVATAFAGIAGTSPRKPAESPAPQPAAQYNASEVDEAMRELNALESFVINEKASLEEVKAKQPELLQGLTLKETASPLGGLSTNDGPLGIPSFLWGCVLGLIGILVVYLVTEDKDETKKALLGCLVGSLLSIAFYGIAIATGMYSTTL